MSHQIFSVAFSATGTGRGPLFFGVHGSAVKVDRVKIATYSILGLCTGIAALLVASRLASISSSISGTLYELDVIAAVVIGGTRMRGGFGTVAGTVIGVLILGVIQNMLNLLQVSVYLQGLVKGLIIVGAVLLQWKV
jgi:ribose transport system permease protein